ncbi:MAG: DNA internalization-related competence protein ComEC/Rec2 [Lachnospiraceae bacterium]|nr:DNA internalization-related competence protein ComEC/Rec2 [Lachnospiraceae bacterium]
MVKRPLISVLIFAITGIISAQFGILGPVISGVVIAAGLLLYWIRYKRKIRISCVVLMPLTVLIFYFFSVMHGKMELNGRKEYERITEGKNVMVLLEGSIKSISDNGERIALVLEKCMVKEPGDEEYVTSGGVRAYLYKDLYDDYRTLEPGNKVKIYGKLATYEKPTNPGQFDSYGYNARKHIYAMVTASELWIEDERTDVIRTIVNRAGTKLEETFIRLYPEDKAGVLTAMLLGERSLMDEDTVNLYKTAGISHILAISGLHISLICMGMYSFMDKMRVPKVIRISITLVLLVFYVCFTGMGVSAVRAGIMTSVSLLAKIFRKHYDMMSALCLAALLLLAVNPAELFDVSFLLSVAAVVGVFAAERIKAGVYSGLVISLVTQPILLWFFYESSSYGTIANIFILPLSSLVILFGGLSAITGILFLPLGGMFAGITFIMLTCFEAIGKIIGSLPYSYICTGRPSAWRMIVYYGILVGSYVICEKRQQICVKGLITAAVAVVLLCFIPKNYNSMAFLDVGQGDGIVNINGKECTVIDSGSSDHGNIDKYVLAPYLKYHGITVINRAIVTHMDEDHINGIVGILERMQPVTKGKPEKDYDGSISIKNLILPKVKNENIAYTKLKNLAREKNVNIIYAEQGHSFTTNDLKCSYTCLAPFQAEKSENGTSLIYRFENDDYIIYLTGDGDKKEEKNIWEKISAYGQNGKFTILKAGHHGSRTSSSEDFLEAVAPNMVIISCGKGNKYGHPHKEVLEILNKVSAQIRRTDTEGAIIIDYKRHISQKN